MHRGVEVTIGLSPRLAHDGFVAEALGNLAASELARERGERLEWQILRVETTGGHHYRIVVRHPDRVLDLGFAHALERHLKGLARLEVGALRARFDAARAAGLKPVPLRHVHETVDLWHDDFWNWIG